MSGQVGWGGKGRSRCTHSKKKTTKKKETAPLGSLSLSEREREREREKKNQKPRVGPVGGATQTPVKNHITPTISGKASKLIFLSFSLSLSLSLSVFVLVLAGYLVGECDFQRPPLLFFSIVYKKK